MNTTAPNPTVTVETKEAPETRAAGGRFAKGNRGGPGNPFARQTAQLRQALVDAVTPEDIRAVADGLKKKAMGGDVAASKLLFSYCLGKEDPDTLDRHEVNTIMTNHLESGNGLFSVLSALPLDVLMSVFRIVLPVLSTEKMKFIRDFVCAPPTAEEIEERRQDEEDARAAADESESASAEPDDPLANIPEWMHNIGKEPEPTPAAPKPARKRARVRPQRQPGSTGSDQGVHTAEPAAQPAVDLDLLRLLLERARQVPANGAATQPGGTGGPAGPSPQGEDGRRAPSTNGANGKK